MPHTVGGAQRIQNVQRMITALLLRAPRERWTGGVLYQEYVGLVQSVDLRPYERPGVVGVGIFAEDEDASPSLHLFLETQRWERVADALRKRFEDLEFPIETVVTGPIIPCAQPAQGGDSIGYGKPAGPTGTLGCVVRDIAGNPFILSCNHVIAAANKGTRGIDEVWHPGSDDGGNVQNRIGVLHDFKDIVIGGGSSNDMDAALAKPDSPSVVAHGVRGIGPIHDAIVDPAFGTIVKKSGRETGITTGSLQYKTISHKIEYAGRGEAIFENQYGVLGRTSSGFAQMGDSGAIVLDDQQFAVGLLFAVASQVDMSLVNPIDPILRYFSVEPV